MSPKDTLLALLIVLIWGVNFTIIKVCLVHTPPMFMALLRFIFAAIPAIFFVPRPRISWKYFIAFAMFFLVGQFSLLFFALDMGMPAGLASILMQSQVFFTLIFSYFCFKDHPIFTQVIGIMIAALGLIFIGSSTSAGHLTMVGFGMTLVASASLALGNITARKIAQIEGVNILHFVIWANVVPILPFFILTLIFDGLEGMHYAFINLNQEALLAIAYQSLLSTIVAFALWTYLLRNNLPNKVAPYGLLIPAVGIITGYLILDETLTQKQWLGTALLTLGLFIHVFSSQLMLKIRQYFATK